MILCLRLCLLRASRSFSTSSKPLSKLLPLFQTQTNPQPETHLANLILSSHGYNKNPTWSSHQFGLLVKNPDLLIRVLNMIRQTPEIAFRFFKWRQTQRDVKQSLDTFVTMLEILIEKGLVHKAYWVAERSVDLGMYEILNLLVKSEFDRETVVKILNLLLWVYSKKSMTSQCLLCFDKMFRFGYLPSVKNCNIVLRLLRDTPVGVSQGYKRMVEGGVVPTVVTFNTMLDSCFRVGDLEGVGEVLEEMGKRGVGASEVTYNVLVKGYSKAGRMEEARRWHGDMRRGGFRVTDYSFNRLIEGYWKKGMFDEMSRVGDEMIYAGVAATTTTYNIIMRALCELGKVDNARQLLLRMVAPDVVSFNTLMFGCIKIGKVEEAFRLFDELRDRNIFPSVVTFNTLIDGLCESGNLEGALKLKEEMSSYGIDPDVKTYTTLVKGCVKNGKLSMATAVYNEMLKEGIKPDRYAYTTRIVGELQLGDGDKAFRLQEELVLNNKYNRDLITYNVCIDGFCKVGNPEKALEFQRKIHRDGLVPDHVTYTTIIHGYLEKRRFEEARALHHEMLKLRLTPTVVTYFVLIHGHAKAKRLAQAFQYSTEMKKRGIRPNVMTCNALLHGICKSGDVDEADRYFCNMEEEEGIPPNKYSYTMLINKNSDHGKWEEVIKLYKKMLDKEIEPDAYTHWALFKHLDKDHRSRELELLEKLLHS